MPEKVGKTAAHFQLLGMLFEADALAAHVIALIPFPFQSDRSLHLLAVLKHCLRRCASPIEMETELHHPVLADGPGRVETQMALGRYTFQVTAHKWAAGLCGLSKFSVQKEIV